MHCSWFDYVWCQGWKWSNFCLINRLHFILGQQYKTGVSYWFRNFLCKYEEIRTKGNPSINSKWWKRSFRNINQCCISSFLIFFIHRRWRHNKHNSDISSFFWSENLRWSKSNFLRTFIRIFILTKSIEYWCDFRNPEIYWTSN